MSDYIHHHETYQQFVALILAFAAIGTWGILRLKPHYGFRMRLPLWGILVIAFVLRLPAMFQDYWYDETFTSLAVGGTWERLWAVVLGDVHPPLYYAIVKVFVMVLGHHDFVMRLPALLSGLGLVYAFYWIGRVYGTHWIGKINGVHTIGLWCALIVACMPAAIYYSAEARYPSFLALSLAVAYIGIQRRQWWLTSLMLVIASLTHVDGWFSVIVLAGLALLYSRRWWVAIFPALAIVGWLPFALEQSGDVANGFWLRQSIPVRYLVDMTISTRLPDLPIWVVLIVASVAMAITGAAVWQFRRLITWHWLAVLVIPAAGQWLAGEVWHPIYLSRTMLFSALLLSVPLAYWFGCSARRWVGWLGIASVAVMVGSLWVYDRSPVDEYIKLCGDSVIYAPSTYSAILATHYSDSMVVTSPDGNTTAQSLPQSVREKLWVNAKPDNLNGMCLLSLVDSFTPEPQIELIYRLTHEPTIISEIDFAYYIVENSQR